MTLWPAIGNVEQIVVTMGQRRALGERKDCSNIDMGTIEIGMKTAETQTELIDESSPNSPLGFEVITENTSSDNNNDKRLNINSNSFKDTKDFKCIDDDSASGHRILFAAPDNPETKL